MPHEHDWKFVGFGSVDVYGWLAANTYTHWVCHCGETKTVERI